MDGKKIGRRIRDPADGLFDWCCWDDCEKPSTTLWRVRIWEGTDPRCGGAPIYSFKHFCSNRHRMYYINAPKNHRNLPAGHRLALL